MIIYNFRKGRSNVDCIMMFQLIMIIVFLLCFYQISYSLFKNDGYPVPANNLYQDIFDG